MDVKVCTMRLEIPLYESLEPIAALKSKIMEKMQVTNGIFLFNLTISRHMTYFCILEFFLFWK